MPLVRMRRTTRVFGARVLRSGRRVFPTREVFKHTRRAGDWIQLLEHGGGDDEFKENGYGWRNSNEGKKGIGDGDGDGEPLKEIKLGKRKVRGMGSIKVVDDAGNRRWGLVYSRKRVRSESSSCSDLDKKFGKKFCRKQSGKKIVTEVVSPSVLLPIITTVKARLSVKDKSKKRNVKRVSVFKSTRSNVQNLLPRNGFANHHCIRKRRSLLRTRKLRSSLAFGNLKSTGDPVQIKANPVISKSIQKARFKEIKEITQDLDSASCNASILVIESDRCRREVGAVITMEMVGPKQWFLVVKRNGVERFRIDALNVMRPCFCNRVTHAIIWASGDESWKLEFSNRQDWIVFKELYRECSERTVKVQSPSASIIPVPRVTEVSDYPEEKYLHFKMPDLYIRSTGDEVSRMLEKSGPVYDMDCDDEEWLSQFNDGRDSRVDEDTFEEIIDAFERGIYCSPEDFSDVTMAVDRCLILASRDVIEAVCGYWIAKRAKHSTLVRVFQLYKAKGTEQLNLKSVLRKKRSFRQRGIQAGRGKQLTFLKAALYEETKTVEGEAEAENSSENTTTEVEETESVASWAEQSAVRKRQRAQLLTEVADLLTYKAAIAVKIAGSRETFDNTIDKLFFTSE